MTKKIWTPENEYLLKLLCKKTNRWVIERVFEGEYTRKQLYDKIYALKLKPKETPLEFQKHRCYINKDFFKKIDSKAKAYVLGYWVADGHLGKIKNGYKINFTSKDKDQILLIKNLLQSEHKIYKRNDGCYYLDIKVKDIYDSLLELGFDRDKSKSAIYPNLREDLHPHFIRGVFDGDGCISYDVKHNKYVYPRINIIGTTKLIEGIINNVPFDIQPHKVKNYDYLSNIELYSKKAMAFLDYIYQDSENLRLQRKYKRYQDAKHKKGIYDIKNILSLKMNTKGGNKHA